MAILAVNSGSSSLKLALYNDDGCTCLLQGTADSIGSDNASITVTLAGEQPGQKAIPLANQHDAFDRLYGAMQDERPTKVNGVGHRIVHGGPHLVQHHRIDAGVLRQLRDAVHFAPLHLPPAIDLIEHTAQALPDASQFACFDTAFHQTMPPDAYTYAIPKVYRDAGVRRYGFHGLSYESIVRKLGSGLPERTVVAHLGSGSSACAMLHGKSQDTSMGLSPTGGLVMATRPGDLDPEVVLLMQRGLPDQVAPLSPDDLETTLNHACGLKALAGETDFRKLLTRAQDKDADTQLAINLFCREITKTIAGYITVLGGLDTLIFTGGIGEHSAPIRENICDRLLCCGVQLSHDANKAGRQELLSKTNSQIAIRIVPADENGQIALHVARLHGGT